MIKKRKRMSDQQHDNQKKAHERAVCEGTFAQRPSIVHNTCMHTHERIRRKMINNHYKPAYFHHQFFLLLWSRSTTTASTRSPSTSTSSKIAASTTSFRTSVATTRSWCPTTTATSTNNTSPPSRSIPLLLLGLNRDSKLSDLPTHIYPNTTFTPLSLM
jgi:hypothetical protein